MTTHVGFVLDMSGSMTHVTESTKQGVIAYIKELRKTDPDALFTLTAFDSGVLQSSSILGTSGGITGANGLSGSYTPSRFERFVDSQPLSVVHAKGAVANYRPRGGTPLYDAIADTIDRLKKVVKSGDKVIVAVMTDGYENSSRQHTHFTINNLVTTLQEQGNWTFNFLGANIDAPLVAQNLGFFFGNVMSYDTTPGSVTAAFRNTAHSHSIAMASSEGSTMDLYKDANVSQDVRGK